MTDENLGVWIETFMGHKVNPFDPDPDTIVIEDIAHALAHVCRYTGHCSHFYSVGDHSVTMANLLWVVDNAPTRIAFEALLHDATEAYIADIARPLKPHFVGYKDVEANLDAVIRRKFGLPEEMSPTVRSADMRMLITESRALGFSYWEGLIEKFGIKPYDALLFPVPRPPIATIKSMFLNAFSVFVKELAIEEGK